MKKVLIATGILAVLTSTTAFAQVPIRNPPPSGEPMQHCVKSAISLRRGQKNRSVKVAKDLDAQHWKRLGSCLGLAPVPVKKEKFEPDPNTPPDVTQASGTR